MNNLLTNPVIQSVVVPLLVALIVAGVLPSRWNRYSGLSFAAAFYTSAYLTVGLQLVPLNHVRKILLSGLAAILLGILLDVTRTRQPRAQHFLIGALGGGSAIWILMPVITRSETGIDWVLLCAAVLFAGWLTAAMSPLQHHPRQGIMATLALATGLGLSTILSSSVLIGQLCIAVGAIAGGYLLLYLFKKHIALGMQFTLPVGLLIGLLAISGVVYATLSWYSLIPLFVIPVLVRLPINEQISEFKQWFWIASYSLPLALIAVIITWIITNPGEAAY